jgi:hypothetical protein
MKQLLVHLAQISIILSLVVLTVIAFELNSIRHELQSVRSEQVKNKLHTAPQQVKDRLVNSDATLAKQTMKDYESTVIVEIAK